ncbi:DNA replication protein DnaC [Forsythia ovata]|uniref:DNA replication protein DnaC n=1 Tax=Forsythia ovata TaxID=205694 RepID=A0ABD1U6J4_9LAMI
MDDFDIELDEMELVAAAAGYHYYNSITRRPVHSVSPKGSGFLAEVLNGHDDLCREMFRMDRHVFHKLSDTLRQRGMLRDTAGSTESSPVLDEEPDPQMAFSIQEQMASSRRDSIAAAMWNDFINKWDECWRLACGDLNPAKHLYKSTHK